MLNKGENLDNKKNIGIPFRSIKKLDKRRKYIEKDLGVKKVYIYIFKRIRRNV